MKKSLKMMLTEENSEETISEVSTRGNLQDYFLVLDVLSFILYLESFLLH